jgi:hypothetical protein
VNKGLAVNISSTNVQLYIRVWRDPWVPPSPIGVLRNSGAHYASLARMSLKLSDMVMSQDFQSMGILLLHRNTTLFAPFEVNSGAVYQPYLLQCKQPEPPGQQFCSRNKTLTPNRQYFVLQ